MVDMKTAAIITAGGEGKRFGSEGVPKQFAPLCGKPLISYSIESFERSELISEIIIVVPQMWIEYTQSEIVDRFNFTKVSRITAGGKERQKSVELGFNSISADTKIVVIQDGVRPFVTQELIEEVVLETNKSGAAIAAVPSTDTIKLSTSAHSIESTLPRENIWLAQTPQGFKFEILSEAIEKAAGEAFLGTDEALLVERLGRDVKLVKSSKYNIKITTLEDLEMGELILKSGIFKDI